MASMDGEVVIQYDILIQNMYGFLCCFDSVNLRHYYRMFCILKIIK